MPGDGQEAQSSLHLACCCAMPTFSKHRQRSVRACVRSCVHACHCDATPYGMRVLAPRLTLGDTVWSGSNTSHIKQGGTPIGSPITLHQLVCNERQRAATSRHLHCHRSVQRHAYGSMSG